MRLIALASLTSAAALIAAPAAFAQRTYDSSVEELTITGHLPGAQLRSLSETVSYRDLDLTYAGDRHRLEVRVNNAARRVCTQLNEDTRSHNNLGKSCQDRAVREAMDQVHQASADARSDAYADRYGAPTSAVERDEYGPRF
jgi:UrcA family protein